MKLDPLWLMISLLWSIALGVPLAFLILGAIFDFNGTIWNLLVAWSTARISGRLGASNRLKIWFNRCVGSIFVFVGIRLALARDR